MRQENKKTSYKRKPYSELTFTDDFMFRTVLRENPDICKRLVELLLDVEVDHIELKGDDYSLAASTDVRSIRMDVYLNDDKGTVYDIEMQNMNHAELPKRTRYYQSMIDIKHLEPSMDYSDLPDSYIIFICTFDPFGYGLSKYEFADLCRQYSEIELMTGAEKVFINAKGRRENISEKMQDFLDYLCDNVPRDRLTEDIENDIVRMKDDEARRGEYMYFEAAMMDARRDGRAEGRIEGKMEDVKALVDAGVFDVEKACELLGVDVEEYKAYKFEY